MRFALVARALASAALALLVTAGGTFAQEPVRVVVRQDGAPLRFAAEYIVTALERTGQAGLVMVGEPTGVGTPSIVLEVGDADEIGAEGFRIRRTPARGVVVTGGDERGAMYGGLAVAEEISFGVPLQRLRERDEKPAVRTRAIKFNLPLAGTAYLSEEDLAHNQWFYDLEYWRRFLDMMAENRYNVLSLWSAHPYDQMVRLEKFPEACTLTREELDKSIAHFRAIFRMAKERAIDTYLVTWNIHYPGALAKKYGLPESGYDSPLVREYMRECVRGVLQTYPDLTGLGTCPGEAMPGDADWKEEWIRDTYLEGIRRSGRAVPFILRYWGGEPKATAEMLGRANYSAPVYLDIKFNGEHMYSSPRPHLRNQEWLTQEPKHYSLLWHLRNDDIYILRWGDPEFASATALSCTGPETAGYTVGSEVESPGLDRIHTPQTIGHKTWDYEFEKSWFRWMVWGRCGYNPFEPESTWIGHFNLHFGKAGEPMYRATLAASKIIPTLASFHWNYMNGDWYPEANIGGWNTSAEMPRVNYREGQMFHGVMAYIFNNCIDEQMLNIPEYAALLLGGQPIPVGRETPVQVAERLAHYAKAAEDEWGRARGMASMGGELECASMDMQAAVALGRYYSEKILGANSLALFLFSGQPWYKDDAVRHLEAALGHYRSLADIADRHYLTHEVWLMGEFDWGRYVAAAEKDVETARSAEPFALNRMVWAAAPELDEKSGAPGGAYAAVRLTWAKPPSDRVIAQWVNYHNQMRGQMTADFSDTTVGQVRDKLRAATVYQAGGECRAEIAFRDAPAPVTVWVNGEPAEKTPAGVFTGPMQAGGNLVVAEFRDLSEPLRFTPAITIKYGPESALQIAATSAAEVVAPMELQDDPQAEGGKALVVPEGVGHGKLIEDASTIIDNGWATFEIDVPFTEEYSLWIRAHFLDTASNSFFYVVDGGPAAIVTDETFGRYHWVRGQEPLELAEGKHRLTIRNREDGAKFDRILLLPPGVSVTDVTGTSQ